MSVRRVLHVIGGGDTGGAMSHLLPLMSALRTQGCDAHLLCLGGGGLAEAAKERGLPCTVLEMSGAWDPRIMRGLRRRILDEEWDVVHTHGMRANLPLRACFPVKANLPLARPRPLLFTTIHSDLALDYAHGLKSRAYVALDRLTWGAVDGLFCVCAYLSDRLVARGVDRSRIRVVYSGLEMDSGRELLRPQEEADARLVPPPETVAQAEEVPVVGTVARLVDVKDLSLFIEAIGIVSGRGFRLKAVIVGDGPQRAALEQQTRAAGLEGTVEFRGEVRPAWGPLSEFDVYALTSISEGVPLSVLEAMSAGLPVVATAVGGIPEVVEDGVTGYLIARGDDRAATAAAIADRLEALLGDSQTREGMGRAAAERVVRSFTTEAAARETIHFYERIAAGRSDRGA